MIVLKGRSLLSVAILACRSAPYRIYIPRRLFSLKMSGSDAHFGWKDLDVGRHELSLDLTLNMGQCFNWKKMSHTKEPCWIGLLAWEPIIMKQASQTAEYLSLHEAPLLREAELHQSLQQYYQLDSGLSSLYAEWGLGCGRMKEVTRCLAGARVVRQDPWECLISFICSSNNNIPRITMMLERLRRKYGRYVCTVRAVNSADVQVNADGLSTIESCLEFSTSSAPRIPCHQLPIQYEHTSDNTPTSEQQWVVTYTKPIYYTADLPVDTTAAATLPVHELYEFPTVSALADASEEDLRSLGMGYRAKFIINSAKLVRDKCIELNGANGAIGEDRGEVWFDHLRDFAAQARYIPVTETSEAVIKIEQVISATIKQETIDGVSIKAEQSEHNHSTTTTLNMEVHAAGIDQARLQVQNLLLELPGVGRKVADCVALFSLDQTSAVPVDTHVWNIAIRDYAPQLRRAAVKKESVMKVESAVQIKAEPDTVDSSDTADVLSTPAKGKGSKRGRQTPSTPAQQATPQTPLTFTSPIPLTPNTPGDVDSIETRSLTPAVYEAVGGEFRRRFGLHAGWAHSVLFAAELGVFKDRLPASMQSEMKVFADLQRSAKKVKREEKAEALKSPVSKS